MVSKRCYERWDYLFKAMKHTMIESSIHRWMKNGLVINECRECGKSMEDWMEELEVEMFKWEEFPDILSPDG